MTKKNSKNRIMMKAVSMLVVLSTLLCSFFSVAYAEDADTPETISVQSVVDGGPEISAEAAVVIDINTGAILFAKNPQTKLQPSSLCKVMTAYIALEELDQKSNCLVSNEAVSQYFPTAANAGLKANDTISVSEALKGMLMASDEDCTYVLAEKAAGSMSDFATKMNTYAASLKMNDSHFINGNGRAAEGQVSTAYDMALLSAELMKRFPSAKTILSEKSATVKGKTITSSHRFLSGADSCDNFYAGKTGGSAYGGDDTWALLSYAQGQGLNLACIIMGGPSLDSIYSDTKLLFNYAFSTYKTVAISDYIHSGVSEIGSLFTDFSLMNNDTTQLSIDSDAFVILPTLGDDSLLNFEIKLNQLEEFTFGYNIIGSLDIIYDGRSAGAADIYFYTEDVAMSYEVFSKSFPSYLKNPDSSEVVNLYNTQKDPNAKKATPFMKFVAATLKLFTPAKTFSAVVGLLSFLIGTILIVIVFPSKGKPKKQNLGKLYKKVPDTDNKKEADDELSEVYPIRTSVENDMHEIS